MRDVYIGLGSNLDLPRERLLAGLDALAGLAGTLVLRVSRFYRTPPWGMTAQPDFLNAVAELDTALAPRTLVRELLALERMAGRTRDGVRWGPRRLDLDLLVHGGMRVDEPGCRVPHPRLGERAFVLVPLAELAPRLLVPGAGVVATLLAQLPPAEVAAVVPEDAGD